MRMLRSKNLDHTARALSNCCLSSGDCTRPSVESNTFVQPQRRQMSRRTYISKWDPKQSMQMSYVRRLGDRGGKNPSARGRGKGRGQVSTFQAATAGIPRNRRDDGAGDEEDEDEEPYRDNEEADDPQQQVRWYDTHAPSNAKAMFGGAEAGTSTNRRTQDDEGDHRDVAAPSVRRYAVPVRTVQRVGLFGNAKQSECIQNLDQVYPNLQKRVQRQLNAIAAPEDDVEWMRGKVPQMQAGNREMEHGKERRRMHDDMNEADMGRGQGMFDQPPSRRAFLSSPNAEFQQNDDVNFDLQPQTLAAHDNRRKRTNSQRARQRADRYEAIRQRVTYTTRLIAEDDEEGEAEIYDRSPPSSSYREPEDGQRKTTSMFASPRMQLPVITDRILQALPPVYLRDDTVESYDSAVIGILAESMRVNKIRNQLFANATEISEHDKTQDKAIRKKQATAMSSFLDKTQCLHSDDLEDDSDEGEFASYLCENQNIHFEQMIGILRLSPTRKDASSPTRMKTYSIRMKG
ncbi:hypothetical protein WR25_15439 isoform A [Diploscapter pachys]|uniref:Uncharacterized protein n=1 Tax=Diploscapter pachys TaxID=2018661 RepID=A0A2A2JF18_9BILA|nr:hypothetical protein WR25_15439 isoform A [Diploscapter pachys]